MSYTVSDYGAMLADEGRMRPYLAALERAVTPRSVVLDIGTGTGVFALHACRLGARRVFAVEPGEVIEVAREIARVNEMAERIEFVQDVSTRVTLPERADVIVSDLRGLLPVHGSHLVAIEDARRRLLAPGGTLIPRADELWASLVEAPDEYDRSLTSWESQNRGFDFSPARMLVANSFWKIEPDRGDLLSAPDRIAVLDYRTIEHPNVSGRFETSALRDGTAHGVCVWFDTTLAEGVGFSNAPGQPTLIYGRVFFPLPQPVPIRLGDPVSIAFDAALVTGDYVYRWRTRIGAEGAPRAVFDQSTLNGVPLSRSLLERSSSRFAPQLSDEGETVSIALGLMDGALSIEDIARVVRERLGDPAGTPAEVLALVTRLSQKYGRAP
jgi:protein arginine N-methyltransferase 1